jgi:hypothetical protein
MFGVWRLSSVCNFEQTAPPTSLRLLSGSFGWGLCAMQRRENLFYSAIRTKIGDALKAQYDLNEPLPERLTRALLALDVREVVAAGGNENQE